jgi:hypothetical protein
MLRSLLEKIIYDKMETKQAGQLAEEHRLILTSQSRLKHSKEDASSFIHLLVTSSWYKCL